MRSLLLITAVLCSSLVAACGKGDKPPPPSSGAPNAKPETGPGGAGGGAAQPTPGVTAANGPSEAQKLFMTLCATCHGTDGTGNGPAAESLPIKPRNYTDAAWQASVTDDDIKKIIVEGGQAVGKSAMMPANPQLKDKPEVVTELVSIIRAFGKQ